MNKCILTTEIELKEVEPEDPKCFGCPLYDNYNDCCNVQFTEFGEPKYFQTFKEQLVGCPLKEIEGGTDV